MFNPELADKILIEICRQENGIDVKDIISSLQADRDEVLYNIGIILKKKPDMLTSLGNTNDEHGYYSINSLPEVKIFLKNGGFVKEREDRRMEEQKSEAMYSAQMEEFRNTKNYAKRTNTIAWIAIAISAAALVKDFIFKLFFK